MTLVKNNGNDAKDKKKLVVPSQTVVVIIIAQGTPIDRNLDIRRTDIGGEQHKHGDRQTRAHVVSYGNRLHAIGNEEGVRRTLIYASGSKL